MFVTQDGPAATAAEAAGCCDAGLEDLTAAADAAIVGGVGNWTRDRGI
jgi:hypothetical protein